MGFDRAWAASCIEQLAEGGIEFGVGLDDAAIDEIAAVFGAEVPEELRLFLSTGVPTSPEWPRWGEGPQAVRAQAKTWIERAFRFDVTHSSYWKARFGPRPADDEAAMQAVQRALDDAPPLIPIYAHRFLTTAPAEGPRAVLSVWQAVDSIYYGNDLADYFAREFGIDRPQWAAAEPRPVPVWGELFDLLGDTD